MNAVGGVLARWAALWRRIVRAVYLFAVERLMRRTKRLEQRARLARAELDRLTEVNRLLQQWVLTQPDDVKRSWTTYWITHRKGLTL